MTDPLRDQDWAARFRAAEVGASRVPVRPLTLEGIESRGRRQRAVHASWAAAALLLAFVGWNQAPWSRPDGNAPVPAPGPTIQDVIRNLQDSLRTPAAPAPVDLVAKAKRRASDAVEHSLTTEFRTNYRLAEAGDVTAWVNLHQLSRKHPNSHGGRSARAYLASTPNPNQSR